MSEPSQQPDVSSDERATIPPPDLAPTLEGLLLRMVQLEAENQRLTAQAAAFVGSNTNAACEMVDALQALERERVKNELSEALILILRRRDAFVDFITEVQVLLFGALDAAECGETTSARQFLRTIRVNSDFWGLTEVAALLAQLEEVSRFDSEALDSIVAAFGRFLAEHERVLGVRWDDVNGRDLRYRRVPAHALQRMRDAVAMRDWASVEASLVGLERRLADELLGPLERRLQEVARANGREVEFQISGGDILVDPLRLEPVLSSVVHLVCNAAVHGIEERRPFGKAAKGRIWLSIEKEIGHTVVRVGDDGRGIDRQAVVAKAIEGGWLSANNARQLSHEQTLSLIFQDGLSTSSSSSAAGEGLASVVKAARLVGAQILLKSEPGQGVEVCLLVPDKVARAGSVDALEDATEGWIRIPLN